MNNLIYTYLSARYMVCRCINPFNIRDFITSFTESTTATNPDIGNHETGEELKETLVFETHQLTGNPITMVATNIPSIYGGQVVEGWRKTPSKHLLPKDFIQKQEQDLRQGVQSYSDSKIELLAQDSAIALAFKQIKRMCQLQSNLSINFREDIPDRMPVYISIDGENYVLFKPKKVKLAQSVKAGQITVLRGPILNIK